MRRASTSPTLGIAVALAGWFALHAQPAGSAFPGANGRIAFEREGEEVFSILPNGTGETNLTNNAADDDAAAWSPDGTRIAFSSNRDGDPHIFVMDADGQNPAAVTNGSNDDHPAWSPDGTQIVFQREEDGDDDIFVVTVDGSGAVNLTNDPGADDEAPAWSPDGSRIAFCSEGRIVLINPDGTGRTTLPGGGASDCSPNWSPDGTQIAFDSDADGDLEIFVMNADGSGRSQRTFNTEDDGKPAWSPDGTKIVFQASRGGNEQIHVIDAGGGNETAVTDASNPDDDEEPDWQPLPGGTTTTTVTGGSTTTTTIDAGRPAAGRKLLLKDKAGVPAKRALVLRAKDAALGQGAENGGSGDPVIHGGFLKVVSSSGDGFNATYNLPAERWRYKGKQGKNKGYKLAGAGPIATILVRLGKSLEVVARGDALGHSLGADPAPVHVALGLGAERYCFTFGGQTKFKPGKTFVAKNASPPGACAALIPACGDRLLEPGESCPVLEGPADGLAVDALFDLPPVPAAADDVVNGVTLTRLDVVIAPAATVGQVNDALETVDGLIVGMVDDLPFLTVGVPRQASPEALAVLAATLRSRPGILLVLPGRDVVPAVAPPPPADAAAAFGYLQDARFPAAWNARALAGACTSKIPVIVADYFQRPADASYEQFATQVPDVTELGAGSVENVHHGYDVLTTLAAKLDATVPTGANPFLECLDLKALQVGTLRDQFQVIFAIDQALPTSGKVIVNASFAFAECGRPCTLESLNPPRAVDRATWGLVQRAQLRPAADRVLVTSAAGNDAADPIAGRYVGNQSADFGSSFNVAARADSAMTFVSDAALWEPTSNCPPEPCLPSLTATPEEEAAFESVLEATGQTTAQPAGNVVIVGSTDGIDPSDSSEPVADVFAVGEGIPTLLGTPTEGTSFAAPQVAALAAYLWMLSPELRGRPVADTIAAIKANVEAVLPAGQINAYATVLSLDDAEPVTPGTAPVRLAILDDDADGDFDLADLRAFHDAFVDDFGNVIEPSVKDFSRHDLNGDGFTGGTGSTSRMDLDPTGSTKFGAPMITDVTVEIVGEERTFEEFAVSDLDALCFYANTGLYSDRGNPAARDALLSDFGCGASPLPVFEGTVTQTFESVGATLTVSITETYTVRLEARADGGFGTSGNARLLVSLEEDCQPGNASVVVDASTTDRIRDEGDADTFEVAIEADVEGTITEIGTGSCEENIQEPFEGTIRTERLSTPEFADNRVVALVWDVEIADAPFTDPVGNVHQGLLRITGRLERVD